jgi:hypothetical protein
MKKIGADRCKPRTTWSDSQVARLVHSKISKRTRQLFRNLPKKCPLQSPSAVIEVKQPELLGTEEERTNMAIHEEVGFMATQGRSYQIPAMQHQLRSGSPVREQEQSVDDLRAAIESLQQIVCELLLRNQILRMALGRDREIVTTSSATGFPNRQSRDSGDFFKTY